jgi:hypothetical protein
VITDFLTRLPSLRSRKVGSREYDFHGIGPFNGVRFAALGSSKASDSRPALDQSLRDSNCPENNR